MIKAIIKQLLLVMVVCILTRGAAFAAHNQAPDWMHALTGVPIPAHDEKTNAVLLYGEENLAVLSADKFRRVVRRAYKILRPEGHDEYGTVRIDFDSLDEKVTSIHAWCIPAEGKDYEVTDKDAIEVSALKGEADELISSTRTKGLLIPAPDPGNIIGYEYVIESHPTFLQDFWAFQEAVPVRESHYSLALPSGWEFKAAWTNYPEVKAHDAGGGLWQWTVGDVKEVRREEEMPPLEGVVGVMVVTLLPPGGAASNLSTWHDVGEWYRQQSNGALEASPEIKQEVSTLTASASTPLAKMQALAEFMQRDFRYVEISLKIGRLKPHPAAEVFTHRYGDCKDKATLLQSMLREIGVDSYYVFTNIERGSVTPETPPHVGAFDHAIVAIRLPEGVTDPSLTATINHPKLGTLLIFDPTNPRTPFGQIGGYLQANYSLLATPSGGELVKLPQQLSVMNGIRRCGKLTLTNSGNLQGDVEEIRMGDPASIEREDFISAQKSTDQIKPVEHLLADSLAVFHLTKAGVSNVKETDRPFIWNYSFQCENYAKTAGNLLLVRPRVLGRESSGLLETPEPRRYPVEFPGPEQDTDSFDITLPPGYVVDDLPPAIDADFSFASYHAKTEVTGNVLHYRRTYEIKELSVPVSEVAQLQKFYRIISSDERNNAVLKLTSP